MNPFAVEQIWHAGRPVKVAERGSTLALLVEGTVRRITAAAASPTGCPCCRCAIPIRRAADLQLVTVAVAYSDVEEFRALARVYCARCAPDADTAEATAAPGIQGDGTALPRPRAAVDGVEAFAETPGKPPRRDRGRRIISLLRPTSRPLIIQVRRPACSPAACKPTDSPS